MDRTWNHSSRREMRFGNMFGLLVVAVLSIPLSNCSGALASNVTDNAFTQWNAIAQRVVRTLGMPNQIALRTYAFVALSQYKALQLAYEEGLPEPEVATIYAAHYVLSELFPFLQSPIFDGVIAKQVFPLNLTEKEDAKYQKAAFKFAETLLKSRVSDGSQKWAKFVPAPLDGPVGAYEYLPNQTYVFYPQLGSTTPFVIGNPEDWDNYGPPPKIPSAEYDTAYNTSNTVGNANSPLQTQAEKDTAKFYEDGANTSSAAGQLFNVTFAIAGSLSLRDTAKLAAILFVGGYDAQIVTYHLKYKYNFWRPYTAITNGDPEHPPNPNFATEIKTPNHPDYPSGHSTSGGSFASSMTKFLGISVDDPTPYGPFQVATEGYFLPPRTFSTISDLVTDVDLSRVYGGVHFQPATVTGYHVGFYVSNYVWDNFETVFGGL